MSTLLVVGDGPVSRALAPMAELVGWSPVLVTSMPDVAAGHSCRGPNLDFYAVEDDQEAVLSAVVDLGVFGVFEAYSEPDIQLREFSLGSTLDTLS